TPFVAGFIGASNRLEGRISAEGRAEVEGFGVEANGVQLPEGLAEGAANGAAIDAFIRPHDVELRLSAPIASGAIPAARGRIARLGWMVKIELKLATGRLVTVQQTKEQVEELGIGPGDPVFLSVRGAKVFAQGYSI